MKTLFWLKDSTLILILAAVMTFMLTVPAHSQDTIKKNSKTVLSLKIVKDENGKKTVIDTTFTSDRPLSSKEMKALMSDLDENLNEPGDDGEDLGVFFDGIDLPDSGMMDSIRKMTDKYIVFGKDFMSRHKGHGHQGYKNFDFDFDIPELPIPPEPPIPLDEHSFNIPRCFEYNDFMDNDQFFGFHRGDRGGNGSVMDLLGDIPLDKVKNFKIQDKKNTRKITIEVERESYAPMTRTEKKVIIIRSDNNSPHPDHDKKVQKKVIIKSGKEGTEKL